MPPKFRLPALPLLLAIKGTVYDITKGRQFFGPDGGAGAGGGSHGQGAAVASGRAPH